MTSEKKPDAGVQARLNMYDYATFALNMYDHATFVETDLGVKLCTLNLFDSSFVQPGRANGPY